MLFVTTTTLTAGAKLIPQFIEITQKGIWHPLKGTLNVGLMVFVMACVAVLLLQAVSRWIVVLTGPAPVPLGETGSAMKGGIPEKVNGESLRSVPADPSQVKTDT